MLRAAHRPARRRRFGCVPVASTPQRPPFVALTLQTHPPLFRVPRSEKPGFGGFCRGWEFVGQTPWCYTNNDCPDATGPEGAKYKDCIQLAQPPPPPSPPPPPPAPPPPPSPPPVKIVESKGGWGTPEQCPCSGWSSKHGFGSYCKGWELEGQTPWCYVTEACPTTMTAGGASDPLL